MTQCNVYWRSHACDLPMGHVDSQHMCCPHIGEPGRCQNINCDDDDCVDADVCHNEIPRPDDELKIYSS